MKQQSKKTRKKIADKLSSISSIVEVPKKHKQSDKKKSSADESDNATYHVTPKGILLLALSKVFGKKAVTLDKLDEFTEILLKDLSRLSSNDEKTDLFGTDFNAFFSMFVKTMNLCGLMQQKLDENGIEFDPNEVEGFNDKDED